MYINVASDLFIGVQELNKLISSLDENGFRKLFLKDSIQFGLFDNSTEGNFTNGLVRQGTNVGTLAHGELYAVDNDGQIIYKADTDNIALVDDSLWKWVKISHLNSPIEPYLVSVDKNGNLTATGGAFLSILRGLPNNPVKISFPDASLNTQANGYEVVEVIDDNNAVLAGSFLAESNIQIAVIGAFTPDVTVPTASKFPFRYDSCTMTLVTESSLNTAPTLSEGEYLLARIRRVGAAITIQDKRSLNIYRSKADFEQTNVERTANPVIGVDGVTFDDNSTPRDKNKVTLSWGVRSSNFTVDSSINRVTLIAIESSGKYKTTANLTDGDLDGWRIYTKDGTYSIIKQSALSAGQINLYLDTLDVDKYSDTTQELTVVPNCEEIELQFDAEDTNIPSEKITFPIKSARGKVSVTAYGDTCVYTVSYRYKNLKTYGSLTNIGNDAVGYYDEDSYQSSGELQANPIDRTLVPYTSGEITITRASDSYRNVIDAISTGDAFGHEFLQLNNVSPIYTFEVGQRKKVVCLTSDDDTSDDDSIGAQYTLTADHYIDLRTDVPAALKVGNEFLVQIRGDIDLDGFTINFTSDYVNSGDVGNVLLTLSQNDITEALNDNLLVHCLYNANHEWQVYKMIHVNGNVVKSDSVNIAIKVLQVGDWDMVASTSVSVNHGLDATKIRSVTGMIVNDAGTGYYPIGSTNASTRDVDLFFASNVIPSPVTSTAIRIARLTGGVFDNVGFDSTSYNRGHIVVTYEV